LALAKGHLAGFSLNTHFQWTQKNLPALAGSRLVGLSGGKDSSALAIYLRDKVPEMEYFFTDTGAELPETLAYIDMLEDYFGKPIKRLNADHDFDYYQIRAMPPTTHCGVMIGL